MKKIIIFLIFFLTLSIKSNVFSYSLDFSWKWFYSNISNNISDVNSKMFTIETLNNWWLKQKITEKIWIDCLVRDLTENELYDIAINENNSILIPILSQNCFKDWEIDQVLFNRLSNTIKEIYIELKNSAKNKTYKALSFSNIWIYSDWIEENAPFDLMKDFEEIDKIIFNQTKKENNFIESEEVDLSKKLDWLLNKVKKNISNNNQNSSTSDIFNTQNYSNKLQNFSLCSLDWNCDNYTEVQKLLCEKNWNCNLEKSHWFLNLQNNFFCKSDTSWLNTVSAKIISSTLSWNFENDKNHSNNSVNENFWNNRNSWNKINIYPNPSWWYEKVNDNKHFPCNDFFCIDINFKTFNFGIFWDPTIEFLIDRSNNHLKKFMNTSLAQAKMTLNNFELNLKDINLPDMFHMWVQISYEPVPILKIDDSEKDKEDKWELKLESQLEKYYQKNGLEYRLRNDLSAFNNIEKERQATLNSNSTVVTEIAKKYDNLNLQKEELLKSLENTQKLMEEKVKFERLQWIEKQLTEVNKFNAALNSYIINLQEILKEIKQIPIDKSKT